MQLNLDVYSIGFSKKYFKWVCLYLPSNRVESWMSSGIFRVVSYRDIYFILFTNLYIIIINYK